MGIGTAKLLLTPPYLVAFRVKQEEIVGIGGKYYRVFAGGGDLSPDKIEDIGHVRQVKGLNL
ncbi:MAG: hypothetical protein JRJ11_13245 [Deltaproteobacteria bacterium]|nr:hypothetical protein [Deltaproteobacteria bacterium]